MRGSNTGSLPADAKNNSFVPYKCLLMLSHVDFKICWFCNKQYSIKVSCPKKAKTLISDVEMQNKQ